MSSRSRKLINHPHNIVREMLEGYVAANSDILALTKDHLVVRRVPKAPGKVGLVIGNGSGHEPAMIGFVGAGLFDVNVPGPIFAAPPPARLLQGILAAERGAGVLLCVSHHAGDLMAAETALAQAATMGLHNVEMVVLYDDVASAPRGQEAERRGTAGLFFTWKMLGAFAETGASLAECKALAEKVRNCTRTLSMALTSCCHPVTGELMFELSADEMEIGMGVHGEAGVGRTSIRSADETIDLMLPRILEDLPFVAGDEVCVLLNNAGSMTLMELSILYRRVQQSLKERGMRVHRAWLGSYATTQDMAGFGLSLCRVDAQMKELYDAPANGVAYKSLGAEG